MRNHGRTPYLEKRGENFYFRRRLPFESNLPGNKFFTFSLRTDVPSDAREITARLTAMTTLAFDYKEGVPSMDQETFKALLTEFIRFEIAAFETSRLTTGPRSLAAAEFASKREQAIQDTLRQAIYLREWDHMRTPLECVAERLGVTLPVEPISYATLAHEALRVSIDISRERQRRDRGEYTEQSAIFSEAIGTKPTFQTDLSDYASPSISLTDAFAVTSSDAHNAPAHTPRTQSEKAEYPTCLAGGSTQKIETPAKTTSVKPNVRDTLRSKNLLRFCSDASVALLEKGAEITIDEAFEVYFDFKKNGCSDEWERKQKPDAATGEKWKTSSLPNLKVAKALWTDLLNDVSVGQVLEEEVDETISIIRSIPKNHGKTDAFRATKGYLDLIERTNKAQNKAMCDVERDLRHSGCANEEEIRDACLSELIPRIRVQTYVRHVRCAKRIGTMLHALGITQTNIFNQCSFTNDEEKRLKATEDKIVREKWDDRIVPFFESPVFQGHAKAEDDPLFWMPVLGRCQGLRSEEAAQLGPDDISSDKGIHYLRVRKQEGDTLKSAAAFRLIPIHPALMELGFLELVKRARARGNKRLLPSMTRGQIKGTFTENFTKSFGYYRKTNNVYWHGLDFHALRTTFHHDLMDGKVPGYAKRCLMGHEPLDEGEKSYAQNGISVSTLYDYICTIPFDAKTVKSPILSAKPNGLNRKAEQLGLKVVGG